MFLSHNHFMQKKYILFFIAAFLIRAAAFSQATTDVQDTSYNKYRLPSISAGTGIMTFFGDIGTYDSEIAQVGMFNRGFSFSVEQRIGKAFGISLNALKGTLSEVDNRPTRHMNFKSDVFQGNLGVTLHIDNGFLINSKSRFAPYLTCGFGYMTFEAYGDLFDKDWRLYYYWPDGTIRDQDFDWENPQKGDTLHRDYSFETKLDSTNKYTHNSLTVSTGGGLNFKFSDKLEANISSVYYFTKTDAIDNLSYQKTDKFKFFTKHNDGYLYTFVTLQYNLGGKSKSKIDNKYYKDVDFKKLNKTDSDGDKVKDSEDQCPDTPTGVKVDSKGCPLDDDKDGVPNYLDKEPNTLEGKVVDENGVTLTPKMIEEKFVRDSLIMAGLLAVDRDSSFTRSDVNDSLVTQQSNAYYQSIANNNQNQNQNQNQNNINNNTNTTNNTNITNNTTNTTNTTNTNNTTINLNEITSPIGGVIYRVQIGSMATADSKSYFASTYSISDEIYVDAYQGSYKYAIGTFYTYASARQYANSFKARTGVGAFVISFKNGTRIPVSDAKVITGQ